MPLFEPLPLVGDVPPELEQQFVRWCTANGVVAPKFIYPAYDSFGVRGVIASADIAAGETLIRVPSRLTLTTAVARADPRVGHVWDDERVRHLFDTDVDVLLASYLTYIRTVCQADHPLWPWVRTLPDVDTLADWSQDELLQLQDSTLAGEAKDRDTDLKRQAIDVVCALTRLFPELFPADKYTRDWWRWAGKQLTARAFGRRVQTVTMVPLADCMNHGPVSMKYGVEQGSGSSNSGSSSSGSSGGGASGAGQGMSHGPAVADPSQLLQAQTGHDGSTADEAPLGFSEPEDPYAEAEARLKQSNGIVTPQGTFRIWLTGTTSYRKGEQVLISYGRRDNAFLALEYGFVIENNEFDTVSIQPRPVVAAGSDHAAGAGEHGEHGEQKRARGPSHGHSHDHGHGHSHGHAISTAQEGHAGSGAAAAALTGLDPTAQPLAIPQHALGLLAGISAAGRAYKLSAWSWCSAALPSYRVAAADEGDVASWRTGKALMWTRPVARANEARALRLMAEHLKTVLHSYPTSIEQDETALETHDVRLALGHDADTVLPLMSAQVQAQDKARQEAGTGEEGSTEAPRPSMPYRLWLAVTYRLGRKRIIARHAAVADQLAWALEGRITHKAGGAEAGAAGATTAQHEEGSGQAVNAVDAESKEPASASAPSPAKAAQPALTIKQVAAYMKAGALPDGLFMMLATQ